MSESKHLTLSELTTTIERALSDAFSFPVWVTAEISELNENRTGHCYMELVEKVGSNSALKAKVRATIWARDLRMLKPYFETTTRRKLSAGIKILALCNVAYHPVYGLSLNIVDIDPTYTLGDIELQKQETIKRLKEEGVFDMNRELAIPIPPKRIAIVSSPTAAGFQDFVHQLESNPYGYNITYQVFEAFVQGDSADESIVDALDQLHMNEDPWDLVAIIRGGGSQTDLACFDSYTLANHIAQFPIPIITGIGHERDTTIADMVAHTRLKTPTAAAEFIIGQFEMAESILHDAVSSFAASAVEVIEQQEQHISAILHSISPITMRAASAERLKIQRLELALTDRAYGLINEQKRDLLTHAKGIRSGLSASKQRQEQRLETLSKQVGKAARGRIERDNNRAILLERTIGNLDPKSILKRGYSLTLINGKAVLSEKQVGIGDTIETILYEGRISSKRES